ncbi:hypothetical protein WH50_01050 [Pokkaliibacter plantistimulans]|uniref:Motility protein n=1 Tax=Pokkaliibacter plantistimulans TaxID=1635171 RepID=A0ABX5M264_9GAMM|nr:hypothetical protein WH50_01050 [Pokkaliibacter plantistimulans]
MDLGSVSGSSYSSVSYGDSLGIKAAQMANQQQELVGQQVLQLIDESSVGSGQQPAKPDPSGRLGLNVDVTV